jgi:beta-lactamase class A
MRNRRFGTILTAVAIVAALGPSFEAQRTSASGQNLDRLRNRIETAFRAAQGVVGVSLKHLESSASLAVNGDEPFPMASTFKLPVLIELHAMAKASALQWDEIVEITAKDQHLGSRARTARVLHAHRYAFRSAR